LARFDSGAYSRLQFLRAVSHSVGAHTESLQPRVDSSSSSSENEDEASQAPVPAATTSAASKSEEHDYRPTDTVYIISLVAKKTSNEQILADSNKSRAVHRCMPCIWSRDVRSRVVRLQPTRSYEEALARGSLIAGRGRRGSVRVRSVVS